MKYLKGAGEILASLSGNPFAPRESLNTGLSLAFEKFGHAQTHWFTAYRIQMVGYTSMFSVIFTRGNSLRDFLFASLTDIAKFL